MRSDIALRAGPPSEFVEHGISRLVGSLAIDTVLAASTDVVGVSTYSTSWRYQRGTGCTVRCASTRGHDRLIVQHSVRLRAAVVARSFPEGKPS